MFQFQVYDVTNTLVQTVVMVNGEWGVGLILGAITAATFWLIFKGGSH